MRRRVGSGLLVCCLTSLASSRAHAEAPAASATRTAAEASGLEPRARFAWGNDQFYPENGDDLGFTQDLGVEAHLLNRIDDYALRLKYRLITERYGKRRTDELTSELRWLHEHDLGLMRATLGPALSFAASGNFGGAELQNTWHRAFNDAYTFDHGLADEYPDHTFGLGLGGQLGFTYSPYWWLRLMLGSQLSVACGKSGRSQTSLYDALELESGNAGLRVAASLGVDLERTWTHDPYLQLPGAYETEAPWSSPHFRLALRHDSWEAGYVAHTNVGGAETQFGLLYFLIGGGPAFRHEHALRW